MSGERYERERLISSRVTERYTPRDAQRFALLNDPQYYLHVRMITDMVQSVDKALTAEGMDEAARDRVVFRLLYDEDLTGIKPPDFHEAHNRMADRESAILRAASRPLQMQSFVTEK